MLEVHTTIVRSKEREEIDLFVAQARAMHYRDSEEAELIESTDDSRAPNAVLEEFAVAASKEQVLEHLRSSEDE